MRVLRATVTAARVAHVEMPVVLAYLACALIWGTSWYGIRVCIGEGGYPTFLAAALRFVLAGAILCAICAVGFGRPGPSSRRAWAWTIVAGLLNGVGYTLVYLAEERITGGLSAVLYGTYPILLAGIGTATGVERPTARALIGALIALGGIAVIFADRLDSSPAQSAGVAMVLGSVLLCTFYNLIFKRHAQDQHPIATTTIFLSATAAVLVVVTLLTGPTTLPTPLPLSPTLALLYLGLFGSVIAFGCHIFLVKRVSLMTLSTLVFVHPLVALSADALFESQRLSPRTWLGVGITFTGIVASVFALPRTPARGRDKVPT